MAWEHKIKGNVPSLEVVEIRGGSAMSGKIRLVVICELWKRITLYFTKCTTLLVIGLILICSNRLMASPASPAMLDANGCHRCDKVCNKYGLNRDQLHCHIFSPEALEAYQRASVWAATNDEAQFGINVMNALENVSLTEDRNTLIVAPIRKEVEGTYKITSQSCGFGAGPATVRRGIPSGVVDLFGASISEVSKDLFTYAIGSLEYPAIFTADNRVIILEDKEHIICSGQVVKQNLYLYCKGSFAQDKKVGTKGFCRSAMQYLKK